MDWNLTTSHKEVLDSGFDLVKDNFVIDSGCGCYRLFEKNFDVEIFDDYVNIVFLENWEEFKKYIADYFLNKGAKKDEE